MRRLADRQRILDFLRVLGGEADQPAAVYLTGGATAVLIGWRTSTIDVDVALDPESDRLLRALPRLKEVMELNVELASPADFIPELPGWRDRSPFVTGAGRLTVYHYDFYAQALAKLERGHTQDRLDIQEMLARRLIELDKLRQLFGAIEPELYRYPAIDPASFRRAVEALSEG